MIPSARGPMEDVISDRINTSRDARKVPSMVERRNIFSSRVRCTLLFPASLCPHKHDNAEVIEGVEET